MKRLIDLNILVPPRNTASVHKVVSHHTLKTERSRLRFSSLNDVGLSWRIEEKNRVAAAESMRKILSQFHAEWSRIHLQLRVHLLRGLRRANEFRLLEL